MQSYLFEFSQSEVCRYHLYQGDGNDCGPYSIAMAVNLYHRMPRFVLGQDVARWMNHYPLLARIPDWATMPWGVPFTLRNHFGIPAHLSIWASESDLRYNLNLNRIALVITGWRRKRLVIGGHISVLYAYDLNRFGQRRGGYAFLDPAAGDCLTWISAVKFRSLWRFFGRLLVTLGR